MKLKRHFTILPDYLLEAMYRYKMPSMQLRVLHWLVKVTLGNKRPNGSPEPRLSVEVSTRQAAEMSGIDRGDLGKALRALIAAQAVILENPGSTTGRPATYRVNLHVEQWAYAFDGERPEWIDLEGEGNLPSGEPKVRGISPQRWGESPPGGEGNLPSPDVEKTASNLDEIAALKKKREEERSPQTPQGSDREIFGLQRFIYTQLSTKFYRFGAAPRVAQSTIREFVLAYRDNLDAASVAVQLEMDEQIRLDDIERAKDRTPFPHPLANILNRADARLKAEGVTSRPKGDTA